MKKNLFIFTLIFIFAAFLFAEKKENNIVIVSKGGDKINDISNSSKLYLYFTFENTKLWSDKTTIDEYLLSRKNKDAEDAKADKEKMIQKFYKIFESNIKYSGKKWKLERISSPSDAKEGYLIIFNYDKCVPISGVGAQGYGSINIVKSDDQKNNLLNAEIKGFSMAKDFAAFSPIYQFSELAQRFAKDLVSFLNKSDYIDKSTNK